MGIQHLNEAKELRKSGAQLGRRGLSQRVINLVRDFEKEPSYKGAMILAGRIKAVAIAAKCDGYWSEQVNIGYQNELFDLKRFEVMGDDQVFNDTERS